MKKVFTKVVQLVFFVFVFFAVLLISKTPLTSQAYAIAITPASFCPTTTQSFTVTIPGFSGNHAVYVGTCPDSSCSFSTGLTNTTYSLPTFTFNNSLFYGLSTYPNFTNVLVQVDNNQKYILSVVDTCVAPSATPTITPVPTLAPTATPTTTLAPSAVPTTTPGPTTTPPGSISGNGLNYPQGIVEVGSQIWVSNSGNGTISRFNPDETPYSGGNLTGNGLRSPWSLAVVGNQVWAANSGADTISRFNLDGTPYSGGNINLSGILPYNPMGIAVVGNQVWVTSYDDNNHQIYRFNMDGTPYSGGNISGLVFNTPSDLAVVGNQVWVTDTGGTVVYRFNMDGTPYAGGNLTGNGLAEPISITVVGTQVWITNNSGNTISRFNMDGTSAGSTLSAGGVASWGIATVGSSQVWVTHYTNSSPFISVFNVSGIPTSTPTATPTPTPVISGSISPTSGCMNTTSVNVNVRGADGKQVYLEWANQPNTHAKGTAPSFTVPLPSSTDISPGAHELDLIVNPVFETGGTSIISDDAIIPVIFNATSCTSPTAAPTITPTPTSAQNASHYCSAGTNPAGMAVVGSHVWVIDSNVNYSGAGTINILNTDGTIASGIPITTGGSGSKISALSGMAVVGSTVWVSNLDVNSITIFNADGSYNRTIAAGTNGLNWPAGIAVVGSNVWVANYHGGISIFTSSGAPNGTIPAGTNGLSGPSAITAVGSNVWVSNTTSVNGGISIFTSNDAPNGFIANGTNGLDTSSGIVSMTVVGTNVWVTNYEGNPTTAVSIFTTGASPNGKIASGTNGVVMPAGSAVVNSKVWISNAWEGAGSGIYVFNPDMTPVTVASTCSASPSPTATPTITPTGTIAPTAIPTITPSGTPTPTTVPGTTLSLTVLLTGIGAAGDNTAPTNSSLSNKNPMRLTRPVQVDAVDSRGNDFPASGTVTYDSASGTYKGTVDFANTLPTNTYAVKVKSDNYLRKEVSPIQNITQGATNIIPPVTLIAGDVNNDNALSIVDYGLVLDCYSDIAPARNCDSDKKLTTDLNDDGSVNEIDVNLFLRNLVVQNGD